MKTYKIEASGVTWHVVAATISHAVARVADASGFDGMDEHSGLIAKAMDDDETFTEVDVNGDLGGDREWTAAEYAEEDLIGLLCSEY